MSRRVALHRLMIAALVLTSYSKFLSCDETAQSYYEQGINYMNSGDQEKAIEALRKAVKLSPNMSQLHNALGVALLDKTGNLKLAKDEFELAAKLNPTYGEPYFNIGTYYAGTGRDPVLAAEFFQKATQADPNFSKAYMGLGWIALERHDAKKAVESFEKAVELQPMFAEAQYGLAVAYAGMKKNELALKPITALRDMGRNDLAQAVESVIQENQKQIDSTKEMAQGKAQGSGAKSEKKTGSFLGF